MCFGEGNISWLEILEVRVGEFEAAGLNGRGKSLQSRGMW